MFVRVTLMAASAIATAATGTAIPAKGSRRTLPDSYCGSGDDPFRAVALFR